MVTVAGVELTPDQLKTLEFIRAFRREHLYAPSVREIQEGVGLSSSSAVSYRLHVLRNLGLLTFLDGHGRTIVLTEERA